MKGKYSSKDFIVSASLRYSCAHHGVQAGVLNVQSDDFWADKGAGP